jgi:hypothetical protein
MTKGSGFQSRQLLEFCLLHVVQTGSEANSASNPMGTGACSSGGKAAGA